MVFISIFKLNIKKDNGVWMAQLRFKFNRNILMVDSNQL